MLCEQLQEKRVFKGVFKLWGLCVCSHSHMRLSFFFSFSFWHVPDVGGFSCYFYSHTCFSPVCLWLRAVTWHSLICSLSMCPLLFILLLLLPLQLWTCEVRCPHTCFQRLAAKVVYFKSFTKTKTQLWTKDISSYYFTWGPTLQYSNSRTQCYC